MARTNASATGKVAKKHKKSLKKDLSTGKKVKKKTIHKKTKTNINYKKRLKALGFKSVFGVVVMDRETFLMLHSKAFDNSKNALEFYNWAVYVANYAVQQVSEETSTEMETTP